MDVKAIRMNYLFADDCKHLAMLCSTYDYEIKYRNQDQIVFSSSENCKIKKCIHNQQE